MPQGLVHVALGNKNLVNGASGAQRLNDRVAAFYHIVLKGLPAVVGFSLHVSTLTQILG